jgi:hypothetical protein
MAQHLLSLRGARTQPAVAFSAKRSADIYAPDWNTCSDTFPRVSEFLWLVALPGLFEKEFAIRSSDFTEARKVVAQSTPSSALALNHGRLCAVCGAGCCSTPAALPWTTRTIFATTPWPSPQSTTRARPLEMKKQARPIERPCRACRGTGLSPAKQPKRPGVRVYPPRCAECLGKGKISD